METFLEKMYQMYIIIYLFSLNFYNFNIYKNNSYVFINKNNIESTTRKLLKKKYCVWIIIRRIYVGPSRISLKYIFWKRQETCQTIMLLKVQHKKGGEKSNNIWHFVYFWAYYILVWQKCLSWEHAPSKVTKTDRGNEFNFTHR